LFAEVSSAYGAGEENDCEMQNMGSYWSVPCGLLCSFCPFFSPWQGQPTGPWACLGSSGGGLTREEVPLTEAEEAHNYKFKINS